MRTERVAARLDAVVEVGRGSVVQLRHHHVAQRDIDLPAATRHDLGQQAKCRSQSGGVVGRRIAGQRRRAIGVTGHRRHPRPRLDHVVERRIVAPVHPETGHGHADDFLVEAPQVFVGEPEPADRRRLHIDQQRMGFRDKLAELLSAGLRPQVQADALFVPVEAGEVAVADLAGDLTARRLDLDHLGAEVGKQHRGVGAGEHDADLEYADAGQRAVRAHLCSRLFAQALIGPRWRAAKSPRACGISTRSAHRGCRRSAAAEPRGR